MHSLILQNYGNKLCIRQFNGENRYEDICEKPFRKISERTVIWKSVQINGHSLSDNLGKSRQIPQGNGKINNCMMQKYFMAITIKTSI